MEYPIEILRGPSPGLQYPLPAPAGRRGVIVRAARKPVGRPASQPAHNDETPRARHCTHYNSLRARFLTLSVRLAFTIMCFLYFLSSFCHSVKTVLSAKKREKLSKIGIVGYILLYRFVHVQCELPTSRTLPMNRVFRNSSGPEGEEQKRKSEMTVSMGNIRCG